MFTLFLKRIITHIVYCTDILIFGSYMYGENLCKRDSTVSGTVFFKDIYPKINPAPLKKLTPFQY